MNQRSDRFYNFTFVRAPLCASVTQLISETAQKIFPKLGMKLGDNEGNKIVEPFFWEKSHFAQIWPKREKKMAILAKNTVLGLCEKRLQQIFQNCTKSCQTKLILYDRIVILSGKILFWCQIRPNKTKGCFPIFFSFSFSRDVFHFFPIFFQKN